MAYLAQFVLCAICMRTVCLTSLEASELEALFWGFFLCKLHSDSSKHKLIAREESNLPFPTQHLEGELPSAERETEHQLKAQRMVGPGTVDRSA